MYNLTLTDCIKLSGLQALSVRLNNNIIRLEHEIGGSSSEEVIKLIEIFNNLKISFKAMLATSEVDNTFDEKLSKEEQEEMISLIVKVHQQLLIFRKQAKPEIVNIIKNILNDLTIIYPTLVHLYLLDE